jgi:hypothetical protein
LAAVSLVLCENNRANAAAITINTPAGLAPGDTFRIIFVTWGLTDPSSSDINYYNSFVNTDPSHTPGGGAVTYNGSPVTFLAIASTPSINAITNIGQTGAPVYLVDGTKVAASDTTGTHGLWSGTLLSNPSEGILGTSNDNPTPLVYTGTQDPHGTASLSTVFGSGTTEFGRWDFSIGGFWVALDAGSNNFRFITPLTPLPIYGISADLTVVPEPASIVLCLSAAGCGAVGAYARRRWQNRRVR